MAALVNKDAPKLAPAEPAQDRAVRGVPRVVLPPDVRRGDGDDLNAVGGGGGEVDGPVRLVLGQGQRFAGDAAAEEDGASERRG